MGFLADGELLVVETDEQQFLGTVEVLPGVLLIRSGFVGRPVAVAHEDVVRVVPHAEWADEAQG